jgi:hypothetical protein
MSENYTTNKLLRIYFKNTITSMIYGLFKKEELIKNSPFSNFYWADSFLIIKCTSNSKYNMIKTTDPKYYAGQYGSYRAKPFHGNYIQPHKYFLRALPYAFKAGRLSIFYHAKTLIQSYRINFAF